tara:strand:- start:11435 stop:11725 length:291 start_codon:yes stop_codon:yes gene_type:complete
MEKQKKDIKQLLDEIRDWTTKATHPDGTAPDCWVDETLQQCLETIVQLQDENESLWNMLDEIKAADMENYTEQFQEMLDQRMDELKLWASIKPAKA